MAPAALSSGLQGLSGGLAGLVVGVMTEEEAAATKITLMQPSAWQTWTYLLVLGTLLSYSAYLWLVRNVSSPLAASNSFVNPVIAAGVGAGRTGERLNPVNFIAIPLVIVCMALIVYKLRLRQALLQN